MNSWSFHGKMILDSQGIGWIESIIAKDIQETNSGGKTADMTLNIFWGDLQWLFLWMPSSWLICGFSTVFPVEESFWEGTVVFWTRKTAPSPTLHPKNTCSRRLSNQLTGTKQVFFVPRIFHSCTISPHF